MPGQMAGLSGAAAVLEPARPAVELPVAVPIPARETPAAAASTPAGPSLQRAAEIGTAVAPAALASPRPTPPALAAPQGILVSPVWTPPPASITQVLSPQQ